MAETTRVLIHSPDVDEVADYVAWIGDGDLQQRVLRPSSSIVLAQAKVGVLKNLAEWDQFCHYLTERHYPLTGEFTYADVNDPQAFAEELV